MPAFLWNFEQKIDLILSNFTAKLKDIYPFQFYSRRSFFQNRISQ